MIGELSVLTLCYVAFLLLHSGLRDLHRDERRRLIGEQLNEPPRDGAG
jgi:hypothetical protein